MINFGALFLMHHSPHSRRMRRMHQLNKQIAGNDNAENRAEEFAYDETAYWLAKEPDVDGCASVWKCSKCGCVVQFAQKTKHGPCEECPKCAGITV